MYFILLFIYCSVLFYGSYFIQAGFYIKSICSANTNQKEIALSFDDGPANDFTPAILDILSKNNIEAAFNAIVDADDNELVLFDDEGSYRLGRTSKLEQARMLIRHVARIYRPRKSAIAV
jgi:peptidoglycan/xylan/chitin deacetylase (PgdA/CDA1 family)